MVICVISMYEICFEEMRVAIPFSKFVINILNFLKVAPFQLHLLSWCIKRCFNSFVIVQEGIDYCWMYLEEGCI
jgi:hypothetical protein